MTNWIPHNGGECPVAAGTMVDIKFNDEDEEINTPANYYEWRFSEMLDYPECMISHYRLHTPDKVTVDSAEYEALLSELRTAEIVMENLPERPGYNGSILDIDDTEAARVAKAISKAIDALQALKETK